MISLRNSSLALLMLAGTVAYSQTPEPVVYYVNVNDVAPGSVHNLTEPLLHLEYHDAYSVANTFLVKLYDWQRNTVATLNLDKSAGFNHYTIDLDGVYSGWQQNKVYTAEFKDEGDNWHRLPFRLTTPAALLGPAVDIMVNPIEVTCNEDLQPSLVEFYGIISGGKAPYNVSWYVLNKERTDFLYQPREETLPMPGKTPLIRVDRDPAYYVVFYVKDACGGEQKRIVNMTCSNNKKKINTIFVEELEGPLLKKKAIR